EKLGHLRRPGLFQPRKMLERLPPGQLRIEHHVFRQITKLAADGWMIRIMAQYADRSRRRFEQPENELHGGGLASTIMAKQPKHLPRPLVQAEVMQYRAATLALLHILEFDRGHY